MILVDTSVVIDYTRGKDVKLRALLPTKPVALCGVVRAEVLCGARNQGDRGKLLVELAAFQNVSIPEALWDAVGDNLASLRTNGITVPLSDAVIATLAIENDIEVWARDPHFPMMQKVLPKLKLFQEPP
jgi:predicted nucleic acid-binding protein